MGSVSAALRGAAVFLAVLVCACGGGGGGSNGPSIAVSTNSLSFSAANQTAPSPPMQTFTATVTGGTVYVAVFFGGVAISNVTYSCPGGATCNINVFPAAPAALGPGSFSGAVTVYGCADSNCNTQVDGSPQIVNVNYQIAAAPAQVHDVAPYIANSGESAEVIIRGISFSQLAIQNVSFGAINATAFTVVSDTEVRATHPALVAGSYLATLQTSSGAVPSAATLVVVDAPSFVGTYLGYPAPPAGSAPRVAAVAYDAERQALLVGLDYASLRHLNAVLRYAFGGGAWQTMPTNVTLPNLRDLTLSLDGSRVLAIADTALTELDPATLSVGTSTGAPFSSPYYFKNLAMANDSSAVVTTGINGSGSTNVYLYNTRSPAFAQALEISGGAAMSYFGTLGVSANGARVPIIQGPFSTQAPVHQYLATTRTVAQTGIERNRKASDVIAPALDRAGSRVVLDNELGIQVFNINPNNNNYTQIGGSLPTTTLAVVLSPDGTYAYTYDFDTTIPEATIRKFSVAGGSISEVPLTPIATVISVGNTVKMTISPDGGTLFAAGNGGIVVVPTP